MENSTTGWSDNMPAGFLSEASDLTIFLKEGYNFWKANAELITCRFADPAKKTTVIIVHPDSPVMEHVAALDPLKTSAIQKSDCIETVRILQMIRDVVMINGSSKAKETFDDRITFIAHPLVPSWNGGIADEQYIVNVYDTGAAERVPMASVTGTGGAFHEWATRNCARILNDAREDATANLFAYQIPEDHTDLRAEGILITRHKVEQALKL